MEAKGPLELVDKLKLPSDKPFRDYRMWIKIKTVSAQEAWQDVCIGSLSEDIYQVAVKMSEDPKEVKVLVRGKDESSPKSSPRGETGNDPTTPCKSLPPTPKNRDLEFAFSNLTETTSEMTIEHSPTTEIEKYIELAVNTSDPFLYTETSSPDMDFIPLFFPTKTKTTITGFEVVLIDKTSLEMFVKSQVGTTKKLINLCFSVECRDGSNRQFHFSPQVWIGSILEHSKCLRRIFSKAETIEAARKEQLAELKGLDLFTKVQYWIADMFDFKEAAGRLSFPNDSADGVRLLSPYYFSTPEAQYLGNLYASGDGKTLKVLLNEVSQEDNVCTSHSLAPKLLRVFAISKKFRMDASFQKKQKEWIEAQAPIWRGYPESRAMP